MTPEQIEELTKDIVASVEAGMDIASIFVPQTIPFIMIGKAIDKMVPGLAKTISSWIAGNPPTAAEIEDLKKKLAVLADPNLP